MTEELFREGGPHNIRKTGPDQHTFSITIPSDDDGLVGRECPVDACAPAYFKVKSGTGIIDLNVAYCPYCRTAAEPSDFTTAAQKAYATRILEREVAQGLNRVVRNAIGIGPSGKRKLGAGLISIELSMKPARLPPVGRPLEEELRRDVHCEHCGLDHAVFGLATWCPDCGRDVFISHVSAEMEVLRKVLNAVDSRRETLGPRVAARDVENTLEDVVSVCEAVLKAVTRRHLLSLGKTEDEVTDILEKRVRNGFQNLERARERLQEFTGATIGRVLQESDFAFLVGVLEKRHPIAHNLGVVDRKYLAKVRTGEVEGREVRVTADEVGRAIDLAESCLADVCLQLFPPIA